MGRSKSEAFELTYPVGAVARLTRVSPELIRAWERRYGLVEPFRTPVGTRRYRAADIERLLSLQLSALGTVRFAREFAVPLAREIGERWAGDCLPIASEHLATGVLRSMLGSALQPTAASMLGPRIVFATPSGERHELGLQMAALTALGAGANPIYLGAELPVEDLLDAVERADAAALALSLVTLSPDRAEQAVRAIRGGLPEDVHLWLGGAAASALEPRDGVDCIDSLEAFEQRVALLGFEITNGR